MGKSKRKIALLICLMFMLAAVLSGCGGAGDAKTDSRGNADKVYKMKIANLAAENDPLNVGYRYFKEQIEKNTDGRIVVEIYANKAISNSDDEQAEMIRGDIIQMTSTPSFTLAAMNSDLVKFSLFDLPYMFRTDEEIWAFSDSDTGMQMRQELLEKSGGIKAYGPFPIGWVKVSSNKRPIASPADLKGLKIRTTSSEMYIGTMSKFGGNPTPMAYGEVYTALQQGTIDGMMTVTSLYVSDRFYEVQKYMGCINPFAIVHYPIVSEKFYNTLPEDLKAIFDDTMNHYVDEMRKLEKEAEIAAIQTLTDKGMVVTEYSDADKQVWIDMATPLRTEKAALAGGEANVKQANDFLEKFRAGN